MAKSFLERKTQFLSQEKTDEWGIPIPYIEFEWSENELNMAKHMEKQYKNQSKLQMEK